MFELKVRTHFSSAHQILEHQGKCRNLHGHNWNVDVIVVARELNAIGLALDFSQMKSIVKEVIDPLDHIFLNDLPQFSTVQNNPTAENVSRFIYNEIKNRLASLTPQALIKRVDLFETETCSASYYE